MDTYASVMKMTFQRLMLVIASANGFQVFTDEIENAHLYIDSDLKTFTRVGPEFEFAGYNELKYGSLAKIVRALSGLPTIGRAWHLHLAETLRSMRFEQTRYDPNVYMRLAKDGQSCNYIRCHTNDITIMNLIKVSTPSLITESKGK